MLASRWSRALHAATFQSVRCRSLATKRVLPPTAIRTRSPYTPPTPPAFLDETPIVNPRTFGKLVRKNAKMADPYVVPDSGNELEDTELALAIRLSLQEVDPQSRFGGGRGGGRGGGESSVAGRRGGGGKRKAEAIVISDTESETEMYKPPSRKTQEAIHDSPARRTYISTPKVIDSVVYKPGPVDTETIEDEKKPKISFLGIDRRQMERERLERLDRLRSENFPTAHYATIQKIQAIMPNIKTRPSPPGTPHNVPMVSRININAFRSDPPAPSIGQTYFTPGIKFPQGVVKKTWAKDVPRDGTDITIEEVLQGETLYGAVLSAFQWDLEWLWTKIPDRKLQRLVLVMQAKEESDKKAVLDVLGGLPKTSIVFPPMENVSCMHSKLMLLFHRKPDTKEEWLRIAVPSANLVDYDWGERGTMENTVFLIDLPKLPTPQDSQTPFHTSLTTFCTALNYPADVLERLPQYDFSATTPLAFVHTLGGTHDDLTTIKTTGYPGLGTAISALGYNSSRGLEVDFVSSSLGATNRGFVINMYNAAMGFDGMADLARRAAQPVLSSKEKKRIVAHQAKALKKQRGLKPKKMKPEKEVEETEMEDDGDEYAEVTSWAAVKKRFRLYFPSRNTVKESKGGIMSGGTITFNEQMWGKEDYPKWLLMDCKSVRVGVLMHSKMLFARLPKTVDTERGRLEAWAYVGSANFTESGWGKLVMDVGKKRPKLKCKNWECGVIIPVFTGKSGKTLSGKALERTEALGMEVFRKVVPVPMRVPAESIVEMQRVPWFHNEMIQELKRDAPPKVKKQKGRY